MVLAPVQVVAPLVVNASVGPVEPLPTMTQSDADEQA